jgi:predicted kinase
VAVMRERAARLAPLVVTGLDAEGESATARFRTRDGELWVARVTVETGAPHRVVRGYAQPWVPPYLTAALPAEFTVNDFQGSVGAGAATLVVFGGVPGSGKSAVAERVGTALDVPVFALDWLLGAMSPFGMRHQPDLMSIGVELLTTLAYRELFAGRSAIIDTTSEDADSRARWESLARAAGATFLPVVCVCSEPALHQERVERRQRDIPGWADAGDWTDVTARLASFPPWPEAVGIDTAQPLDTCVNQLLDDLFKRMNGHGRGKVSS